MTLLAAHNEGQTIMNPISRLGMVSTAIAALAATSHALAQADECLLLPNGEFDSGLQKWSVEPLTSQSGLADSFADASIIDATGAGEFMDSHVLLLQASAGANGAEGSSQASADLAVKSPPLLITHRYLTFVVAGGYEVISFGSAAANMEAEIEVTHLVQKQLQHQLGQLTFPAFPSCEWGISILGTFEQFEPVSIDLFFVDGQPTGLVLGDTVELSIVLHCDTIASNACDEGLVFAALAVDEFQFCPVPQRSNPGDVNRDGAVNVDDLLEVINGWGECDAPPQFCAPDLTGDFIVDVDDLLIVINHWDQ
jgi:hypothetical protein